MLATKQTAAFGKDEFWKDFLSMADYFNHAIAPFQKHFGLKSQDIFYSLGQDLGRRVAEKYDDADPKDVMKDMSRLWEELRIGTLKVSRYDPLVIEIHDCTICGQLAGTGGMYDCAFHEEFFTGLLSVISGKEVQVAQETNYAGAAGTWCRTYATDTKL
jgi:predicted hydrocarbon binding protein